MSTVKVLHVIARMNVGGTARYVTDLVQNIPGSALATGYVQGSEIEADYIGVLPTYRIDHLGRKLSPIKDIQAWIELMKLIRRLNPEIVHTHTFKAGLIGRLTPGNHKKVHTFHGHLFADNSFSGLERRMITIAERLLAKRTDTLISVGERVGAEIRALGIGKNQPWVSIPPGISPLERIERNQARKSLSIKNEGIVFGWMARVTEVKNPLFLLRVAQGLPQVKFVMAGGGNLMPEVVSSAPANLQILGWAKATDFWSAVDCAISTSYNEGMPIALIEAQLAGVPVIATDVGSTSEVISDGETGFMVPLQIDEMISAIKRLYEDEVLRNQMSRSAKNWAAERFSKILMVQRQEAVYIALS
jgi:glycosyltransferase involved in cell wall biosynthesis